MVKDEVCDGHKKRPVRDLVFGARAAAAGRLHRPAHARHHHYENRCDYHEWQSYLQIYTSSTLLLRNTTIDGK